MEIDVFQSYNLKVDLDELRFIKNGVQMVHDGYEMNHLNLTPSEKILKKKLEEMILKLDMLVES